MNHKKKNGQSEFIKQIRLNKILQTFTPIYNPLFNI
jgi:hypothetical protein